MKTNRLHLRRWQEKDLAPFANMNADPRVMEFFPSTLTREQSDALVSKIEQHFEEHGFGLWCVEHIAAKRCIGFVGLAIHTFEAHFTPAVEIGWRLDADFWRQGLAYEAACVVRDAAFNQFGLDEVVSFTAEINIPSQKLMQKLGMTHDPKDDFNHVALPADHRLSRHVLYRLSV